MFQWVCVIRASGDAGKCYETVRGVEEEPVQKASEDILKGFHDLLILNKENSLKKSAIVKYIGKICTIWKYIKKNKSRI